MMGTKQRRRRSPVLLVVPKYTSQDYAGAARETVTMGANNVLERPEGTLQRSRGRYDRLFAEGCGHSAPQDYR